MLDGHMHRTFIAALDSQTLSRSTLAKPLRTKGSSSREAICNLWSVR